MGPAAGVWWPLSRSRPQLLKFHGYFKEAVPESAFEDHRVRWCVEVQRLHRFRHSPSGCSRRVEMLVFRTDNTVEVHEKEQENSGIPQGVFLKRTLLPRSLRRDCGHYEWRDFNVGKDVHVFGKLVRLYGASGNASAPPLTPPRGAA